MNHWSQLTLTRRGSKKLATGLLQPSDNKRFRYTAGVLSGGGRGVAFAVMWALRL